MSRQVTDPNSNKKFSSNIILFRKNSQIQSDDKLSNSMVILEKDKKFMNFNVVDKEFFNKNQIEDNILIMREEFIENTLKIEDKDIINEKNHATITLDNEGKNIDKIDDLREKIKSKHMNTINIKYNILSSDRSSDRNLNVCEHKNKRKDEILLLRSKKESEEKLPSNLNGKLSKMISNHNGEIIEISSTSEYPYKICMICDIYFNPEKLIIFDCFHIFCYNCAKLFYEEKIEEGKKEFKCPIFKCSQIISIEIIKTLVTEKHLNKLFKTVDTFEEKAKISNIEKGPIKIIEKKSSVIDNNDFKIYSKKHILEITNKNDFKYYSKNKEIYCKNCYKESLFGKNSRNFIKCMNCLQKFCKYCERNFTSGHFDFSGNNYCKIFLRKHIKFSISERNECKEITIQFIIFLLGYLVFFIGVINYINLGINDLLKLRIDKEEHIWKVFLKYFLLILISLIVVPILFMTLPFYPSIVAIFK